MTAGSGYRNLWYYLSTSSILFLALLKKENLYLVIYLFIYLSALTPLIIKNGKFYISHVMIKDKHPNITQFQP